MPLIGPAHAAIARYEGILAAVPNADVLISPLRAQEAVLSSRIEGTEATLGEVLEYQAKGGAGERTAAKTADIQEVLNYRAALDEAVAAMDTLPLSQRLIRQAHLRLMQGVRGRNKAPGDYRRVPNWIGPAGASLEGARFVPASADSLAVNTAAWERFLHAPFPDRLVQLAVIHAEFEAIHPFLDGNGRLGRLLIPLFLFEKEILSRPNFYMSEYLESRREKYYNRLLAVSAADDWTGWCEFFLRGMVAQADRNLAKARAIIDLYRSRLDWIARSTRSAASARALEWMFANPIFRSSDLGPGADLPYHTANRILALVSEEMLAVLQPRSGRNPAVLAVRELLDLVDGRDPRVASV